MDFYFFRTFFWIRNNLAAWRSFSISSQAGGDEGESGYWEGGCYVRLRMRAKGPLSQERPPSPDFGFASDGLSTARGGASYFIRLNCYLDSRFRGKDTLVLARLVRN